MVGLVESEDSEKAPMVQEVAWDKPLGPFLLIQTEVEAVLTEPLDSEEMEVLVHQEEVEEGEP